MPKERPKEFIKREEKERSGGSIPPSPEEEKHEREKEGMKKAGKMTPRGIGVRL